MSSQVLSKSRYVSGLQCPKMLHYIAHQPGVAREKTEFEQAILNQGAEVGVAATKQFPGGVEIEAEPREYEKAAKLTAQAMAHGVSTIYEASFLFENAYARIDILNKADDGWQLVEVKSSSSVKEQYYDDVAFQVWILQQLKIPLSGAYVMHINKQCVYPELSDLLSLVNVDEEVEARLSDIAASKESFLKVLNSESAPVGDIGPHCKKPYDCMFKGVCWGEKKLPSPSVFDFSRIGKRGWEFYEEGILDARDVPAERLSDRLLPALEVYKTGERYVNRQKLDEHFSSWDYPLYYLDFEAINPAIPRFDGTRPFEQVPFQYSAHVVAEPGAEPVHFDYLHTEPTDPRRQLVENLLKHLDEQGSIVVYNKPFEKGVLERLARDFSEHESRLRSIIDRLVDLLIVIKDAVYDPKFLGSYSIKKVAPALLGETSSYEGMAVSDGTEAMRVYGRLVSEKGVMAQWELTKSTEDLKEYCRKDTLLMLKLVEHLSACRLVEDAHSLPR